MSLWTSLFSSRNIFSLRLSSTIRDSTTFLDFKCFSQLLIIVLELSRPISKSLIFSLIILSSCWFFWKFPAIRFKMTSRLAISLLIFIKFLWIGTYLKKLLTANNNLPHQQIVDRQVIIIAWTTFSYFVVFKAASSED